jgi:hypothetical protein
MAFIEPHSIKSAGYDTHRFGRTLLMKTEKVGHHEATQALVLSVAGVMVIMLSAYLILIILY